MTYSCRFCTPCGCQRETAVDRIKQEELIQDYGNKGWSSNASPQKQKAGGFLSTGESVKRVLETGAGKLLYVIRPFVFASCHLPMLGSYPPKETGK